MRGSLVSNRNSLGVSELYCQVLFLGDLDALVRQCRAIKASTRIQTQATPTSLQDMLTTTLAAYENLMESDS